MDYQLFFFFFFKIQKLILVSNRGFQKYDQIKKSARKPFFENL
jgi:hypothetical protein